MSCYFPSGDIAKDYTPCDSGAQESHCCAPGHYCYTNGFCFDPDSMTNYRGGCTDKSFDSQACSNRCLQYSTFSGVWPCGDAGQTWACYPPDCSNSSLTWTMTPGKIMQNKALDTDLGISSVSGTATATATSSVNRVTSATATADTTSSNRASLFGNDDSCPSHAGAMAGIGLGIGVPLLIALAAVSWLWFRDRKKIKGFQPVPTGPDQVPIVAAGAQAPGNSSNGYYEPKWMANAPTSTATSEGPIYGSGAISHRSELPNEPIENRNELDSTTTSSRR